MFSKKVPTIIGVLLLVAGLVAGIVLVGRSALLQSKAGPTAIPRNIKIVNIKNDSFTVAWTTDTAVTGFVKYSDNPSNLSLTVGDSRDQISGSTNPYTTHYVEITGLAADKSYYFRIGSGSAIYGEDGVDGKAFQTKTVRQVNNIKEDTINGKVLLSSGAGASGALVFVNLEGAETLSALTGTGGIWKINLGMARDKNGQVVSYDAQTAKLSILVDAGKSGTAIATTNTGNDTPVGDIILGQSHTFADNSNPTTTTPTPTTQSQNSSFGDAVDNSVVKITYPAVGGEKIATTSPQFLGTGPEGMELIVTLDPSYEASQSGIATISATNRWGLSFDESIALGGHTLQVSYTDEGGGNQVISRVFSIVSQAAGGFQSFTASESAEATGSGISTESGNMATQSSMPATDSGLLDVGVMTPTYLILSSGLIMFVGGLLWRRKILLEVE
jgi:hypothetical protein